MSALSRLETQCAANATVFFYFDGAAAEISSGPDAGCALRRPRGGSARVRERAACVGRGRVRVFVFVFVCARGVCVPFPRGLTALFVRRYYLCPFDYYQTDRLGSSLTCASSPIPSRPPRRVLPTHSRTAPARAWAVPPPPPLLLPLPVALPYSPSLLLNES